MPPEMCLSHFWQFRSVLNDGVHHRQTEDAELNDWMASRHAFRRAVVSGDLSMPSLLEVVGNIAGVWPSILSFLNRRQDAKRTVTVWWYCILHGFASVFISVTDGTFSFRRKESMDTSLQIR